MPDQQGYRLHEWGGALEWETFARPEPGAGEVLLEVQACGIGLTVANYMAGNLTTDSSLLPRVPGHELVGKVVDAGAGVDHRLLGQQAVAYFYLSCGLCDECLRGDEPRCRDLAGWVGTHRDGGYAPWTVLPARSVVPMPSGLDPVEATVVPDALATPLHVCRRRARIAPGERVVVIGAGGGVGIHMVQVARVLGATVLGLDVTGPKLELIERCGAVAANSSTMSAIDPERALGGAPEVVIDLVGTEETLAWGGTALSTGGRLVVVTTVHGGRLELVTRQTVFRELAVLGSRYARRSEIAAAAQLIASGRVRPVIGSVVEPDGLPDVHDQLAAGSLLGRGAVRWKA